MIYLYISGDIFYGKEVYMNEALWKYLEKVKNGEKKKLKGFLLIPLDQVKIKEDYIMVFQESIRNIIKNMELTKEEYKVFFYLLSVTDFENYIWVTQQEIAEELNMKQPNISRALKSLVDMGLLVKEKRGRNNVYKINPQIAWKGKEKNRKNILKLDNE